MAKTQEKNPKVELSKDEQKALAALESANVEVVASMKDRDAETKANEEAVKQIAKEKKEKSAEVSDPAERRRLRMGQ